MVCGALALNHVKSMKSGEESGFVLCLRCMFLVVFIRITSPDMLESTDLFLRS